MRERRQLFLRAGIAAAFVLVLFSVLYTRQQKREPITATSFKLSTVVKITLYDSQDQTILDEAMKLCDTYEQIFSRTLPESELYRLYHGMLPQKNGAYTVSETLAELILEGLAYSRRCEGAFDISIEPISSLWDFTSGKKQVPSVGEIAQAKDLVDYRDVSVNGQQVRFAQEGMRLELGAIAKGYIADRIRELLESKGIKSAIIDLGGNVVCIGGRPDGSPFRVGIQRPFADRNETVAMIEITDQSVVSSGVYERYFEKDGKLYHHILNPKDGYPYENGLLSVTIVSDRSVDGDGLSTSCFALGLEAGMELVESIPDVHAVFITEDGTLHFSEGFEEELHLEYTSQQE